MARISRKPYAVIEPKSAQINPTDRGAFWGFCCRVAVIALAALLALALLSPVIFAGLTYFGG